MSGERSCTNSSSSRQVPTAKDNNRKKHKGSFQVARRRSPHALHASKAQFQKRLKENALTHKHSHTAGSREASLSRGNEKEKTLKQACFQGYPESAVYVQIPIGSRNSAIHNAYHTSLRPSSLFEPRHPSLKVVFHANGDQRRPPRETRGVDTNALHTNSDSFTAEVARPKLLHYPRSHASGSDRSELLAPTPMQELTKKVHSEMVGCV